MANVLHKRDFQSVTATLSAVGSVSASRSVRSGRFYCNRIFRILTVTCSSHMQLAANMISCTVEPPNKGHIGTRSFVLYIKVSFIWRLKCTGIIGIGTSRFVLYREVSFIWSVLYQRFHCISTAAFI